MDGGIKVGGYTPNSAEQVAEKVESDNNLPVEQQKTTTWRRGLSTLKWLSNQIDIEDPVQYGKEKLTHQKETLKTMGGNYSVSSEKINFHKLR